MFSLIGTLLEIIDHLPALLLAGVFAGFFAGLLGIGGGVFTVPALFLVFADIGMPVEWRMHAAIGTSLVVIVSTNLSSVYAHHKRHSVDWAIVKKWALFVAVGALAGSFFAKTLKTEELVYIFAGSLAVLALKMLVPMDKIKLGEALPAGLARFISPSLIGFFSAVMGIGGGSFSVPYLTLYSVPIHRAVGTAALIGLVISISGGLGYLVGGVGAVGMPPMMIGFVHLPSVLVVSFAAVLCAPLGARAAHAMPKAALSIVFGLFLITASVRMLGAV
jgi:uncharacterized protein